MFTLSDADPKDIKIASQQLEINKLKNIISDFKAYDAERKSYIKRLTKEKDDWIKEYKKYKELYTEVAKYKHDHQLLVAVTKELNEYKELKILVDLYPDFTEEDIKTKQYRKNYIAINKKIKELQATYKERVEALCSELAKIRNRFMAVENIIKICRQSTPSYVEELVKSLDDKAYEELLEHFRVDSYDELIEILSNE